eukprot:GHVU01086500.1.p2 GENE.GHVU01086500.1~~GHVU01086500.1.p2  ORF type:complete len:148 (+),score=16.06 GHVU01086500.1:1462-1905(+)
MDAEAHIAMLSELSARVIVLGVDKSGKRTAPECACVGLEDFVCCMWSAYLLLSHPQDVLDQATESLREQFCLGAGRLLHSPYSSGSQSSMGGSDINGRMEDFEGFSKHHLLERAPLAYASGRPLLPPHGAFLLHPVMMQTSPHGGAH